MAALFKYYQLQEKGKWEVTPDSKEANKSLTKMGAKRVSILSVSAVVDESTDNDKLKYLGPMYVDIDSKDLQESIDSTKTFLKKLDALGVPSSAYEIHASGSKGFHVYIHQSTFGLRSAVRRLPYIYGEMAIDLFVPGLDFQVYCGGRGNLFRIPGVKRDDGRYKVPLFRQDLDTMTPESYTAVVSSPRNIIGYEMQPQPQPVSSMVQLFEVAKNREIKAAKERQKTPVQDSSLAPFADNPPQCMQDLLKYKARSGVNFNQVVYQVGIFLARAGSPIARVRSVADMIGKHGQSTSYVSDKARSDHVRGLVAYLRHKPHKQFSCAAMRSVLLKPDCESCQLYDKKAHLEEQYDVVERPDGYYAVSAKGAERRLTNFVLVPRRVVVSLDPSGNKRREYTKTTIERNHERIAEVNIPDDSWNGRAAFLRSFTGIGDNIMVIANDQEIQYLKHYILRDIENVEQQEEVPSVGVHRQMMGGKPRFTYVEPGMSINRFSIPGTHRYAKKVETEDAALPDLQHVKRAWSGDDRHTRAVRNLLQANELKVTSALFGWFMAAHLKAQIFGLRSEFPLLGIWGGRGSGKTQTSSLFGSLHGCEFFHRPPPTFTAITEFAFLTHASASNTVPRIFDEFNKSGMGQHKYGRFSEYLKNLFNNSSSAKGSVKRNNLTVEYHKPTAPTAILSEHQFEVPALRDRLYSVMVREPSLRPRTKFFEQAKADVPFLFQVAKEAMFASLDTREEWVSDRLAHWTAQVPDRFSDRQKFCRAAILLGIDFAEKTLCENMKLDLAAEMADCRQTFLEHVKQEKLSTTGVGTTEADGLLSKLAEMITLGRNDQYHTQVSPSNFRLGEDGVSAFIDPPTAFPLLKLYAASLRDRMPLTSAGELSALLKAEPYYVGEVLRTDMIQSRPVLQLDLKKMEEKGINITAFMS